MEGQRALALWFGAARRLPTRERYDVLVTFAPDAAWRFYDLIDMREGLERIFGRSVDLVERRLVETSENYIRRKHILSNLETIYVA